MDKTAFPSKITRRRFIFGIGLAGSAIALGASGCATEKSPGTASSSKPGDSSSEAGGGSEKKILRLTTGFAISNLIPSKNGFWGNEFGFSELLLRPQPDGNPTDWILQEAVSKDDLTWELTLKDGVHFQNGNPLGAEQLAKLMNYQIENTDSVKGVLSGAKATAEGDKTVILKTKNPVPDMRNILCDEAYFLMFDLPAYLETKDDNAKLIAAKIYTGPYVPTEVSDEKLVMVADENYWGGKTGLDGVEVRFVSDAGARLRAVQNDEVDIALYPPTQAAQTLTDDRAKFNLGEAGGPTFCFYMNERKPVFSDPKVRRAILRMIDYKVLAEDVMQGLYEPSYSFYDPKLSYSVEIWKTDNAEAEKLLTEAGCKKESGAWKLPDGSPLTFEVMTYPQQPDSDALALAIQSQMKKQGVEMSIKQVPSISEALAGNDWTAGMSANGTLSFGGSPISPLKRGYHSKGERNFSKINDPELDAMIEEVEKTMDKQKSDDLLRKIQERIGEFGYNGYTGRRRPGVVVGKRVPNYQPQHALIWVDYKTSIG
ncbi:MAG: hypothetical protein CSB13_02085 [Chloroflexi bacterium]|nr:MAG: hypothetical protein CSB13_02085 [Chloroflexota bacterium]